MSVPASYINNYQQLFDSVQIKSSVVSSVDAIANKIGKHKETYVAIQNKTGVPWFFIGVVHYLESNNDFTKHLHNGDSLKARTVQVPAGLPKNGNPPFTFEFSAMDALKHQNLTSWKDWSIPGLLYQLERYNGFGYRRKSININSPYLWSGCQHYIKGKYVADGKYDANAVSKQIGAAVILRRVFEKHNLLVKTEKIVSTGLNIGTGLIGMAALFFLVKKFKKNKS